MNVKDFPSIFNDVLGPVMVGPSSSHTAGPARIGNMAGQLVTGRIKSVKIEFPPGSSFAATYIAQCSDRGFIGGLLGWVPEDDRIPDSLTIAGNQAIKVDFVITEFPFSHPNTARLTIQTEGEQLQLVALSLGGGLVELVAIDGFPVKINGDLYELLIKVKESGFKAIIEKVTRQIEHRGIQVFGCKHERVGDSVLINIKTRDAITRDVIAGDKSRTDIEYIKLLNPVMPVISGDYSLPFRLGTEVLSYTKELQIPLWEAAIIYESRRSGWDRDRILLRIEKIIHIMKDSIQRGLEGNFTTLGYMKSSAGRISHAIKAGKTIPMGIFDQVMCHSLAVTEYNSAMGVVVASPTAGSCGVLPAAILTIAEQMNLSMEEQIRAMLVAGIIGVFIVNQATFAAEVGGCQAEIGAASAMAAAGVAHLAGGTPKECLDSASLALQNLLGLICDPVGGMVGIPCINRNAMGSANAIVSANMVLGGFDPLIPLDEVISAMNEVGNMMPGELRCTGLGGLCNTKTARSVEKRLSFNPKN